jgi:SnoaL-like domain
MNEAEEQQAPRLDRMYENEANRYLGELLLHLIPEEEYKARHEDYVLEMPQSGERIRGRENMRAFQEAYPSDPTHPPSVRLRRVLVREGLWVVEGTIDYGGGRELEVVMICELRDGKMWRDRWYFAEPFQAPEWRAEWVERMETGAAPR